MCYGPAGGVGGGDGGVLAEARGRPISSEITSTPTVPGRDHEPAGEGRGRMSPLGCSGAARLMEFRGQPDPAPRWSRRPFNALQAVFAVADLRRELHGAVPLGAGGRGDPEGPDRPRGRDTSRRSDQLVDGDGIGLRRRPRAGAATRVPPWFGPGSTSAACGPRRGPPWV